MLICVFRGKPVAPAWPADAGRQSPDGESMGYAGMTRARMPRPHEVAAARSDPRLLRAVTERNIDPAWRARGLCQSLDPETFFPAPNEPADVAVALCRTCAVQGPCLAWALDAGDCHGVWGATTPRERRAMLLAWRAFPRPLARPRPGAGGGVRRRAAPSAAPAPVLESVGAGGR